MVINPAAFGDVFVDIGVREPQPSASEAFSKFGEAHRSMEKFAIRMLKTVKPMISDLNTFLHKAVPDTRLTVKKYLDAKFEYLVSVVISVLCAMYIHLYAADFRKVTLHIGLDCICYSAVYKQSSYAASIRCLYAAFVCCFHTALEVVASPQTQKVPDLRNQLRSIGFSWLVS